MCPPHLIPSLGYSEQNQHARSLPAAEYEQDDGLWILNRFLDAFRDFFLPPKKRDDSIRALPPTFHKFPLLPPELRIKIWSLAFERIVCIRGNYIPPHWRYEPYTYNFLFDITSYPPPIFLANREALALTSCNQFQYFPGTNPRNPRFPMNFKHDIYYFPRSTLYNLNQERLEIESLQCLRRVAVDLDVIRRKPYGCYVGYEPETTVSSVANGLQAFRTLLGVEELSFVVWESVDLSTSKSWTGKWIGIEFDEFGDDEIGTIDLRLVVDTAELRLIVDGLFKKWEADSGISGILGWKKPMVRFVKGRNLYV